jgi:hypothetical protein
MDSALDDVMRDSGHSMGAGHAMTPSCPKGIPRAQEDVDEAEFSV